MPARTQSALLAAVFSAVACMVSAGPISRAAAGAVATLPRPHLGVTSARSVCFGYSAKAKGYEGRDGGYRRLLVSFSGSDLVPGARYTLVPLMRSKSRWTQIGAGISYGFKATTRSYQSASAQVTSVYATDALIVPHQAFAAQFTLTNLGTSQETAQMNAGKLKPGVSNKVTVTVAGSPVSTCPRRLP